MALEFKSWVPSVTVNTTATSAAVAMDLVATGQVSICCRQRTKSSAFGDAILYYGPGVDGNLNPDDANIDTAAANATLGDYSIR